MLTRGTDAFGSTLVLYDGVCALCNWLVAFLLPRDTAATFRFAALQSALADESLRRHGLDASHLDTVYVIAGWQQRDERVFARSRAVLYCLTRLGGWWRIAARAAWLLPRPIADLVYRAVARIRYRTFGRLEACPLPPPAWRARFVGSDRGTGESRERRDRESGERGDRQEEGRKGE